MRVPVVLVLVGSAGCAMAAAPAADPWTVTQAQADGYGLRITLASGRVVHVAPAIGMHNFEDIRIAQDRHTIAWVQGEDVRYQNVRTKTWQTANRDIPAGLVIWRAGTIRHQFEVRAGQLEWDFMARGDQIAMHAGPVYDDAWDCNLFDSMTGLRLENWSKFDDKPAPTWTKNLFSD